MDSSLSRRTFLQGGLLAGAALALPQAWTAQTGANSSTLLGRVEAQYEPLQAVLTHPPDQSTRVRLVKYREVIPIYGASHAGPPFPRYNHNDLWFLTDGGYIHSSYIIPVREIFNEPETIIGGGFWAEVTVPQTRLAWQPAPDNPGKFWLDYGAVYRVVDRVDDSSGRAWYRLVDDDGEPRLWFAEARHLRRLKGVDFAAISPDVPADQKRVEVSIEAQTLQCYEGDSLVFATPIASGTGYVNAAGVQFGFNTPIGEHQVLHKRPSRHMVGGDPDSPNNFYDLPGVPWCSYFTATGAAIHGTYWHNNFGKPQSHGCINVPTDAAHWIYRWTLPSKGDSADFAWDDTIEPGATRIIVA